jgi:hypothetical protein
MWDGYRWWKRGTEKTQKGIPFILIPIYTSDLLYIIKAAAIHACLKLSILKGMAGG